VKMEWRRGLTSNESRFRENGNTGDDGRVALDCLVVEREEIEKTPKNYSVNEGLEIRDEHRGIVENTHSDDGLYEIVSQESSFRIKGASKESALVVCKADEPSCTQQKRNQCIPF
jgi:hypothetical protein